MRAQLFFAVLFALILSVVTFDSFAGDPQVTLHVTGAVTGDIVLELYPDKAPITVVNFLDYVRSGFYDGLIFHRVIAGFMIQGGGYDTGGVKKTPGPPIINESTNGLSNLAGTIAMARTSSPYSATSQFYINHVDNPVLDFGEVIGNPSTGQYLNVGYCVFGEVISGMSFVNAIAVLPTTSDRPDEDVIIESATITLEASYCAEKLDGDVDGDCDVDTDDFSKFAIQWLNPTCEGCYSGDIDGDGEVDFADFAKMTANWLNCNSLTTPCD